MSFIVTITRRSYRDGVDTHIRVPVRKRPSNRKLKDSHGSLVLTDVDGDQVAVPWINIDRVTVLPA